MNETIKLAKTRMSFKINVPDKILANEIINPKIIEYLPDATILTIFGFISILIYGIR